MLRMYREIYEDDWVQSDPQFRTDEDRHAYAIRVLWVRIAAAPPAKDFVVVPFGYTDARYTKAGVLQSRIYVMILEGDSYRKGVLICKGNQAKLYEDVELFAAYKIKASPGKGNVLWATNQTRFENPRPIGINPVQFMTKYVGIKMVRIADTPKALTKTDDNGFRDEFDLRGIVGIVLRFRTGERQDGTTWGVYTISDDSVGTDDVVDEQGNIIPAQFTVWTPKPLIKYDVESECLFVGTVQLDSDGEPFMNAISVVPIRARPIPQVGGV